MSLTRKIVLGIICIMLAGYYGAINLIVPRYLASSIPSIEALAQEYVNGQVSIGKLEVTSNLALTARELSLKDDKGVTVASVPEVVVHISPFKGLLGGSVLNAIAQIQVQSPTVYLTMDKQDNWNVANLLKPTETTSTGFKAKVQVNNGYVLFTTPYGRWDGGLQGTVDAAGNPQYALDLALALGNEEVSVSGSINSKTEGALTFKTESFAVDSFSALLTHFVPYAENVQGSVEKLKLLWSNNGQEVGLSGSGRLHTLTGTVVYDDYRVPVGLDGKLKFDKMSIVAESVDIEANGQKALAKGNIDFTEMSNPSFVDFAVELRDFDLHQALQDIPVEGPIKGQVVLNGTKTALKVTGDIKAKSLLLLGRNIKDVDIPLTMQDDKIVVPNATASIGQGSVNLAVEFGQQDKSVYAVLKANNADIGPLLGLEEELVLNGSLGMEGTNISQDSIRLYTLADLATVQYKGATFNRLTCDIELAQDTIVVNNLSGFSANGGAMLASGKLVDKVFDLKLTAARIPMSPFLQDTQAQGSGYFSGNFTVTGPDDALNITGMTALTDGEIFGQKFIDAHGFVSYQAGLITLRKMELNMAQGQDIIDGTVDISDMDNPLINAHVVSKDIRIDPLAALYAPELKATGNLVNEVEVHGPLSNLDVRGKLHLYDGSLKGFLIDDVVGEYTYSNNVLTLKNCKVQTLNSTVVLDGQMDANGGLNFAVDAENINLKRLPRLSDYADVEGKMSFSGSIKGTKNLPVFIGAVTAPTLKINGETLDSLGFALESDGGNVNKLYGSFHQQAGGNYDADLTLDLTQGLFQGSINVTGGDVASLCRMAKENYEVTGALTGKILINPYGKGSGAKVTGRIDNGAVRDIAFSNINFDLLAQRGFIELNTFKAEEAAGGMMAAQGTLDYNNDKINMEVGGNNLTATILTAFMVDPPSLKGSLSFAAQFSGSLKYPDGNASIQIEKGSVSDVAFDNLIGMVTLRKDMFKLEQLLLTKGEYRVSAYGTFPQDLLRSVAERHNPDAQMDLKINLDNANLGVLPTLTKWVDWAQGNTKGGLRIGGTLESPVMDGSVVIDKGIIKIKGVDTLVEDMRLEMGFEGKNITLKEFYAKVGKEGSLAANGNFTFTDSDTSPYSLDFDAQNMQIKSQVFNGTINASGEITQKRNRPHIKADIRLDDVLLNIMSVPEMGEGQSNVGFDVTLTLGPKIHMHNKRFYDAWLTGGLHLRGSTRFPIIEGNIAAKKGATISYLRTDFDVKQANVYFPTVGSFMPTINLEARSRVGRYAINAELHCPADEIESGLNLTSTPARSKKEILRILTFKSDGGGDASSVTNEDMQGLLDAGLEMTFLGDIEDYIQRALGLSEFRIYSGTVRSGLGFNVDAMKIDRFGTSDKTQYNVRVSKYITRHILVGYSSSFDGLDRSIFAGYQLTDKLSLNFSQDEKNARWYGLQYQTSFR